MEARQIQIQMMGLHSEGGLYAGGLAYIREEKHFNLQSVKLTFLSIFQFKEHIYGIFSIVQDVKYVQSHNKDTRIQKGNEGGTRETT